jgi:hypothetical protein
MLPTVHFTYLGQKPPVVNVLVEAKSLRQPVRITKLEVMTWYIRAPSTVGGVRRCLVAFTDQSHLSYIAENYTTNNTIVDAKTKKSETSSIILQLGTSDVTNLAASMSLPLLIATNMFSDLDTKALIMEANYKDQGTHANISLLGPPPPEPQDK